MLRFNQRQSDAANNVWNTFDALEQPFCFLCSGIEIKHPQFRIENGTFHAFIKQRKDSINIDQYCDNDHQELVDLHPGRILNDERKVSDIRSELDNYIAKGSINEFYWAEKLMTKEAWWPNRHMFLQLVSPFVHWLTSHYYYEDLCRSQFTEYTEEQLDMCATTY